MAISKLILNGVTQMDVTQDTVTAATLAQGETAHDASGVQITGTAAGSNTFTLEYQNVNGVWAFTPTYADIKAAVQQGKVIDYTSFGDPVLGGKYGNGYATNVTFNGTTFSEAVRFYLQDFTFGGVSLVYYGYSSGQLRIQSNLEYLEPQGTLNITTNGTHDVSSYASALVSVSGGGVGISGTLNVPTTVSTSGYTKVVDIATLGFTPTKFMFYKNTAATNSLVFDLYVNFASYNIRVRGNYAADNLSRSTDVQPWGTATSGYLFFNSSTGDISINTSSSYRLEEGNYTWIAIP